MKATESFLAAQYTGSLAMTCIEDAAAFRALEEEWGRLHDACPQVTPFNSWEWLFSWWEAYGSDKRLRLLTWRLHGDLVGIMPLYVASEGIGAGLRVNVLRMIGEGSADSDYLDFVLRPDIAATAVLRFVDWLAVRREWDALILRDLHSGASLPEHLVASAKEKFSVRLAHGRCAAVEFPNTFDEFLRQRQPRFRTKVRALLRKLDEGSLSLEAGCPASNLKARLRSLFALHQGRWSSAGQRGVFDDKKKRLFYAHFVIRFARRGWLRLYSLREGGKYVAHQLCFGSKGVTYLLQEGFDVSAPSTSYGQMLRGAVMRHLIGKAERRYDFLVGFSRHKEDWGAVKQQTVHLAVGRPCWRAWLYLNLPLWRERLATAVRRCLPVRAVEMVRRMRATVS